MYMHTKTEFYLTGGNSAVSQVIGKICLKLFYEFDIYVQQ